MFINKLKERSVSDYPKMTSYINLFLKTEVTCIPKILKNYIGDYYNNALFNGATWVFVLWCFLHVFFDKLFDAFLKKLRYREYVRLRLKNSLWYLGFYGTAVVYSGAALAQNEVELFNFKRMHMPSSSNLPSQVVIGYTLISTFFFHSSLWEGLAKEYFLNMLSYLFLFLFLISSYILRIVEISFTLTALIGVAQVAVEFTRCCFMSSVQDSILSKLFVGLLYFTTFSICFVIYIIVIPLTFVVPLGLKIMSDYPNMLLLFLFFNLITWLIIEIYQSVLFKFVEHWFYHHEETESDNFLTCSIGLLECSLFKPRDDVSYNLQIIKKEIKARQTKMMSMRKPKNKTMLIQTLKCMVAIKRKLSEKRRSDSSDSESEKSDDNDLKTNESRSTDEDNGEFLSDQDEETDDDESQGSVLENEKIECENRNCNELEECKKSDNEALESQDITTEMEKEKDTEEDCVDLKLIDNKKIDSQSDDDCNKCDDDNDDNFGDQSNRDHKRGDTTEVKASTINDSQSIVCHEGDSSTVESDKHVESFKDNCGTTSLVEGDSNAKQINESNRNKDNSSNNPEVPAEISKEESEREVTGKSNIETDEQNMKI